MDFWNQFWPQFWGGVASALFVAFLTLFFTYVARLHIARWFVNAFEKFRSHHMSVELTEEQVERIMQRLREKKDV
jgi:predicted PurR-regulated permease PerM